MAGITSAVWGTGQWNAYNWGAVDRSLTGQADAISVASGGLTGPVNVIPDPVGATSTVAGSITALSVVAGNTAGMAGVAAVVTVTQLIQATIDPVSITTTGDLWVMQQLNAEARPESVCDGQISTVLYLFGGAVSTSRTVVGSNGLAAFGTVHRGYAASIRNGHGGRVRTGRAAAVRTGTFTR